MSTEDDHEPKRALKFQTFEDCMTEQPKDWLIEGVFALNEDSTLFGPPGSLKSALATDIAVHVASGRDWRGYKFNRYDDPEDARIDESRGVVYFALERASLTRRRLAAYATRDGLPPDLPIAIIADTIDLLDPACVKTVAEAINRFEDEARCIVGLVIFDTFAKAIAAGGGDEDKAQTQNVAAAHLKKIRKVSDGRFHIATIGHTGKNTSAGERGSNAKLGHVDMAVQISGDKVRTATVVKGNDQPEGVLAAFEMEEVTVLGKYSDGSDREPYTVAILAAATPASQARTAASDVPTGKHAQVLDALRRAIAARGKDGAVHPDFWKEELAKVGLLNREAKNPRSAFKKLRDAVTQHLIDEAGGIVRIKNEIAPYASPVPTSPS